MRANKILSWNNGVFPIAYAAYAYIFSDVILIRSFYFHFFVLLLAFATLALGYLFFDFFVMLRKKEMNYKDTLKRIVFASLAASFFFAAALFMNNIFSEKMKTVNSSLLGKVAASYSIRKNNFVKINGFTTVHDWIFLSEAEKTICADGFFSAAEQKGIKFPHEKNYYINEFNREIIWSIVNKKFSYLENAPANEILMKICAKGNPVSDGKKE